MCTLHKKVAKLLARGAVCRQISNWRSQHAEVAVKQTAEILYKTIRL